MDYPEERNLNAVCVKLFEYMQVGLPVIVNDLPAMAQIVRDAQCGLLADPLNPEDIADAMVRLLSNEEGMQVMGKNARQAFLENYSWTLAEKQLLAVYDQLEKEL
jgi:glycosyltransferase involved in cell wall biosynthesis